MGLGASVDQSELALHVVAAICASGSLFRAASERVVFRAWVLWDQAMPGHGVLCIGSLRAVKFCVEIYVFEHLKQFACSIMGRA